MQYTIFTVILALVQVGQTIALEYLRRKYPGRTDMYVQSMRPPRSLDPQDANTFPNAENPTWPDGPKRH